MPQHASFVTKKYIYDQDDVEVYIRNTNIQAYGYFDRTGAITNIREMSSKITQCQKINL